MNLKPMLSAVAGAAIALTAVAGYAVYASRVPAAGPWRAQIEAVVRDYMIAHPEMVQEAMAELEKRQASAESEKAHAAVANNADAIFNSPRQVTIGDRTGDVTLVEFFDYNCGYCKHALDDLVELMKTDPKLRVVLKEFPVLGPGSVEAAQVATAVRMQDPDGEKYLQFHIKLLGGRGPADKAHALAVARDVGVDMDRLATDIASPAVKSSIEESFKLAEQLGLNGTPSYVVGPDVVVGAVGLPALKDKVRLARCAVAAASC